MAYKYKDNPDYQKVRLNLYVSRSLADKLENYSACFGVPKCAVCSIALGIFFAKHDAPERVSESLSPVKRQTEPQA